MIRTAAKAVILRDEHLLVIVKRDQAGDYFLLPGGGQNAGEPLAEALQRECLEEIGVRVEIGDLLYVRDYIASNHEFAAEEPELHQLELMFACRVPDDYATGTGHLPDSGQVGVTWLALETLADARLYPAVLKQVLATGSAARGYLGDVN